MGHYVYKYVKDGEIKYIGENDTNLVTRIKQHAGDKKFERYKFTNDDIFYCECSSSYESDIYETLLIGKYNPELNVAKVGFTALNFDEKEWLPFTEKITEFERERVNELKLIQYDEMAENTKLLNRLLEDAEAKCSALIAVIHERNSEIALLKKQIKKLRDDNSLLRKRGDT